MSKEFTPTFIRFAEAIDASLALAHRPDPDTPVIEVDAAVRAIAGFYEKARGTLEYGEVDLLRRRAVARALRRMLGYGAPVSFDDAATQLLQELIRGGYFPNEQIPETIASPTGVILERLFTALPHVPQVYHDELIWFTVFDIEDVIFPERTAVQQATVAFVIATADERLKWPREVHASPAHRAFLFVAAHKVVLRADNVRILHAFLRDALPEWREASVGTLPELSEAFTRTLAAAKRMVAHPRTEQYARALRRLAPAFRALEDAVVRDAAGTQSALQLERRVEESVAERVKATTKKLKGLALRATLYILLTKMVIGLAVELPLNAWLLGETMVGPFMINLIFPPTLMFLVAIAARPPKASVAERIIEDAMQVVTTEGTLGHARLPRQRGFTRLMIFVFAFAGFSAFALSFLLRGLSGLDFTFIDTIIFLGFLSVISLFAWRVRQPLRELASERPSGVLWLLVEIIVFPFLAVGRFLSDGLRQVNVFLWVLDVIIEAPLKFLFAAFEDWVAFLREKREEIIGE